MVDKENWKEYLKWIINDLIFIKGLIIISQLVRIRNIFKKIRNLFKKIVSNED